MKPRLDVIAAPFTGIFLLLIVLLPCWSSQSIGLPVGLASRSPYPPGVLWVEQRLITVRVAGGRLLYLGDELVTYEDLRSKLEDLLKYRAERLVHVFGEPNARYGEVVEVLSIARQTTENVYLLPRQSVTMSGDEVISGPYPIKSVWN